MAVFTFGVPLQNLITQQRDQPKYLLVLYSDGDGVSGICTSYIPLHFIYFTLSELLTSMGPTLACDTYHSTRDISSLSSQPGVHAGHARHECAWQLVRGR